ncbi:MAG: hypothetical protein ACKOD5_14285 [Chthoniobacterales bacterium]
MAYVYVFNGLRSKIATCYLLPATADALHASHSLKLDADFAPKGVSRAVERQQSHRGVLGIQQPVKSGPRRAHALCDGSLFQSLFFNDVFELQSNNALQRGGLNLLENSLITEKIVETAPAHRVSLFSFGRFRGHFFFSGQEPFPL